MDAHSSQAPPPTAAQQDLIAKAHAVTAADSRIVAAWLGGSFAAGTADAYSEIDLNCAVTDESADWFTAHWEDLARQITPLVLAGPVPGALGGYVITPGWLHLDLLFHRRSQCDPAALTRAKPLRPDRSTAARHARAGREAGRAEWRLLSRRCREPVLLPAREPGGGPRPR